jgi:hypothetical protein
MSLIERLANTKPKESGLPCGVSKVLSQMSEEDKEALDEVLFADPRTVSNAQLQEILIDEGYDISQTSITLHRRKHCRCFRGRNSRMSGSE